MEATQKMNVSSEEEDDDVEREKFHTTVFGRLTVVLDPQSKIEETYDIFGGENKIGRDPEQSRIVVDNKVIRVHCRTIRESCQLYCLLKTLFFN
jgi:hypothetical protein